MLSIATLAWAHQGIVLPWEPDEIDYAQAPPDAWMALDLHVSVVLGIGAFCWLFHTAVTRWRVRYGWSDRPVERWRLVPLDGAQQLVHVHAAKRRAPAQRAPGRGRQCPLITPVVDVVHPARGLLG